MINALAFFGNGADVRSAFNAPRAARARATGTRHPHRAAKKISRSASEKTRTRTSTRDIICTMYIYTASSTFGALLLWGWVLRGGERQQSRSFERSRFAHS